MQDSYTVELLRHREAWTKIYLRNMPETAKIAPAPPLLQRPPVTRAFRQQVPEPCRICYQRTIRPC